MRVCADKITNKCQRRNKMRYYWEVLFSTEYFPYWEFTMLMMLCLSLSMLIRINRIENKVNKVISEMSDMISYILEERE